MSAEIIENYEHLPTIPLVYGLSIIITAVMFFMVLNYKAKQLTNSSSSCDDTWKWRNLFISWIHALIVGTWDLSCFYYYPELITDLIAFNNMYIYTLIAFSTGYFFYDFMDIVVSGKLGKSWEVVPHHIAVAGMFFYNVVESRCLAYNVVALLSEVNTIFLHSRKLLQMHKCPFDHWLYRLNAGMNLFTFVSCRFLGVTWIVYGMFIYYERVSQVYVCILASAMFVMWVTNLLLFWRLIQSDIIRPYMQASRSKPSDSSKSNEKGDCLIVVSGESSQHHRLKGKKCSGGVPSSPGGLIKKVEKGEGKVAKLSNSSLPRVSAGDGNNSQDITDDDDARGCRQNTDDDDDDDRCNVIRSEDTSNSQSLQHSNIYNGRSAELRRRIRGGNDGDDNDDDNGDGKNKTKPLIERHLFQKDDIVESKVNKMEANYNNTLDNDDDDDESNTDDHHDHLNHHKTSPYCERYQPPDRKTLWKEYNGVKLSDLSDAVDKPAKILTTPNCDASCNGPFHFSSGTNIGSGGSGSCSSCSCSGYLIMNGGDAETERVTKCSQIFESDHTGSHHKGKISGSPRVKDELLPSSSEANLSNGDLLGFRTS